MSNAEQYFHFTLGPVQGFVAQARRTRDFWAGSFLLSWLSGVAMLEIQRQGGTIAFPVPADNYLQWIDGSLHASEKEAPRQGGIPNRFKAVSASVPKDFDGKLVEAAVRAAWSALAEHVWREDQIGNVATPETRSIWDRQNNYFWEISWAITSDKNASAIVDQRKNWRVHFPMAEEGVKCMVMDGWQELSGTSRPGAGKGSELTSFWNAVRKLGVSGIRTDIAENEHLCALAYVKRRFVRHFKSFSTTLDSGLKLRGWHLSPGIPSVSYVAAVHWLEKLVTHISESELNELYQIAYAVNPSHDEWDTRIHCLQKAIAAVGPASKRKQFLSLDANLFFEHVQDHAQQYGYDVEKAVAVQRKLAQIQHAYPKLNEPLSPFYAVLLMDGDSLGVQMSDAKKQQPISHALNHFTALVPEVVEKHNGFLIYAGGDDVLALLPVEDAIPCAADVRQTYLSCFAKNPEITTSISAAIEFAHVKMPLGKVLGDAHTLLDDVAKDGAGRDALAVRVWKPGGIAAEWAQPWKIALDSSGNAELVMLAESFRQQQDSADIRFSNKFFFKIGERFNLLNPHMDAKGKIGSVVLNENEAVRLLASDFKNSAENRTLTIEQAEAWVKPLLRQSRAVIRNPQQPDESQWSKSPMLEPDAAMLVRFLAHKGVEI